MALNGDTLGDLILAGLDALDPKGAEESSGGYRQRIWRAIGSAIVDHVREHGEVAVSVTSVSGVTAGSDNSGSGSGTGTIT